MTLTQTSEQILHHTINQTDHGTVGTNYIVIRESFSWNISKSDDAMAVLLEPVAASARHMLSSTLFCCVALHRHAAPPIGSSSCSAKRGGLQRRASCGGSACSWTRTAARVNRGTWGCPGHSWECAAWASSQTAPLSSLQSTPSQSRLPHRCYLQPVNLFAGLHLNQSPGKRMDRCDTRCEENRSPTTEEGPAICLQGPLGGVNCPVKRRVDHQLTLQYSLHRT